MLFTNRHVRVRDIAGEFERNEFIPTKDYYLKHFGFYHYCRLPVFYIKDKFLKIIVEIMNSLSMISTISKIIMCAPSHFLKNKKYFCVFAP